MEGPPQPARKTGDGNAINAPSQKLPDPESINMDIDPAEPVKNFMDIKVEEEPLDEEDLAYIAAAAMETATEDVEFTENVEVPEEVTIKEENLYDSDQEMHMVIDEEALVFSKIKPGTSHSNESDSEHDRVLSYTQQSAKYENILENITKSKTIAGVNSQLLYICSMCVRICNNLAPFLEHMLEHAEEYVYVAEVEKTTTRITAYLKTEAQFRNIVKENYLKSVLYKCPLCTDMKNSYALLKRHMISSHSRATPWPNTDPIKDSVACLSCHLTFICEDDFKRHGQKGTRKCPKCETTFDWCRDLHEHMKHNACLNALTCSSCSITFKSEDALKFHRDKRTQACPKCEMVFECCYDLGEHMKYKLCLDILYCPCGLMGIPKKMYEHMAECAKCPNLSKKIYCACGVSGSWAALFDHRQSCGMCYTEPVLCCYCPTAFYKRLSLKNHVQKEHGHMKELGVDDKWLVCALCGVIFPSKQSLRSHMERVHMTHARYQCNDCMRLFYSRKLLFSHMKTNKLPQPVVCGCNESLTNICQIKVHNCPTEIRQIDRPLTPPGEYIAKYNAKMAKEKEAVIEENTKRAKIKETVLIQNAKMAKEFNFIRKAKLPKQREIDVVQNINMAKEKEIDITQSVKMSKQKETCITQNAKISKEKEIVVAQNATLPKEKEIVIVQNATMPKEKEIVIVQNATMPKQKKIVIVQNSKRTLEKEMMVLQNANLANDNEIVIKKNATAAKQKGIVIIKKFQKVDLAVISDNYVKTIYPIKALKSQVVSQLQASLRCVFCKQLFDNLFQHQHENEIKAFCENCGIELLSECYMDIHAKSCPPVADKVQCQECWQWLASEEFLVIHTKRNHTKPNTEFKFTCGTCNIMFKHVIGLQKHMCKADTHNCTRTQVCPESQAKIADVGLSSQESSKDVCLSNELSANDLAKELTESSINQLGMISTKSSTNELAKTFKELPTSALRNEFKNSSKKELANKSILSSTSVLANTSKNASVSKLASKELSTDVVKKSQDLFASELTSALADASTNESTKTSANSSMDKSANKLKDSSETQSVDALDKVFKTTLCTTYNQVDIEYDGVKVKEEIKEEPQDTYENVDSYEEMGLDVKREDLTMELEDAGENVEDFIATTGEMVIVSSCPKCKQPVDRYETHWCPKYYCSICMASDDSLLHYVRHYMFHGLKPRQCPACMVVLKTATLVSHVRSHLAESYGCGVRALQKYDKHPDLLGALDCVTCQTEVPCTELYSHWEGHHLPKIMLQIPVTHVRRLGNRVEKPKKKIRVQKKKIHKITVENTKNIQVPRPCGYRYSAKHETGMQIDREHVEDIVMNLLERNRGPSDCSVCSKRFQRNSDMKRHLIEHLVDQNVASPSFAGAYKCVICKENFTQVLLYKRHMREHANLTLYHCEICDKAFSDSSNFAKHKKVHGISYMQCDACKRKFNSRKMLERHMEFHSRTEPIHCPTCNKIFYFTSSLRKHMLSHDKLAKPYLFSCSLCIERFPSMKSKWDHMWLAHSVRKSTADCPLCDEGYRNQLQLRHHLRRAHSGSALTKKQKTLLEKRKLLTFLLNQKAKKDKELNELELMELLRPKQELQEPGLNETEQNLAKPELNEIEQNLAKPELNEFEQDLAKPVLNEIEQDLVKPELNEIEQDLAKPEETAMEQAKLEEPEASEEMEVADEIDDSEHELMIDESEHLEEEL